MKKLFTILSILFSLSCYGQSYLRASEQVIFSFKTKNGKRVVLAKDKSDAYIVYRFGTKDRIELEFPEGTKESWHKFKYSFYSRGGGVKNSGMELNYVSFSNKSYQYVIYDTYFSEGEKFSVGVKVTDLNMKKLVDIKGDYRTRAGTLTGFRENNLLEIGEDLFD